MSKDEGRKRRESFRQDEMIPMQVELLTFEQFRVEMNKGGVVSQQARMMHDLFHHDGGMERFGASLSPELLGALESLDQKLNYLIAMHVEKSSDGAEYKQRLVNLSSTGIGFSTKQFYKKGDRLKIKMNLPLFPPMKLELLGKVVSVSDTENRGESWVGISFLFRSEIEEEILIKYLFKRQREMLRTKDAVKELQPGI